MTRTTPPRPVDIAIVFPEMRRLARTATRLHPRMGAPTPWESSVGGPLLWPFDEPWPYCDDETHVAGGLLPLTTVADVLLKRALIVAQRWFVKSGDFHTEEERALIKRIESGHGKAVAEPVAMLPVAQLYARDIPDLHPPEGSDLLQVLWCPFDHSDGITDPLPRVKLVWRSSSEVTEILREPPQPTVVEYEGYVPQPCVLHPEQVIEYPL